MTKAYVKWFEQEQAQYGTEVALQNVVADLAFGMVKAADPEVMGMKLSRSKPRPSSKAAPRPKPQTKPK